MRSIYLLLLVSLISCKNEPDYSEINIAIQPFENSNELYVDSISSALNRIYSIDPVVLNAIDFPENCSIKYYNTYRYRADKLIAYLKHTKPDSIDYVIGFTMKDISTTKNGATDSSDKYFDWGIFGLGYRPGPACIVSGKRLNKGAKKMLIRRLQKVASHELGHNFGLAHCQSGMPCVMVDAVEKLSTVDHAPLALCSVCKGKIGLTEVEK